MLRKVYLEITNRCNLRCAFCPGTRRPLRDLTLPEFDLLTDRLRGHTEFLYFHLMGEPLLHPLLGEFLARAGEKGFRVILTTNGTLLDRRGEALLAAPALHKVNLSLQAAGGNPGLDPETYLDTVCAFGQEAAARGILVSYRLWNLKHGVNPKNDPILSRLEKIFPGPWEENSRGVRLGERVYLNWGEEFQWPDLAGEPRQVVGCYGLKDQIGVLCDGTVVPCCLDHEGDVPLGNLFTQDLEEILNGPRAVALREGFLHRKAVEPLCRTCGYAGRFR